MPASTGKASSATRAAGSAACRSHHAACCEGSSLCACLVSAVRSQSVEGSASTDAATDIYRIAATRNELGAAEQNCHLAVGTRDGIGHHLRTV